MASSGMNGLRYVYTHEANSQFFMISSFIMTNTMSRLNFYTTHTIKCYVASKWDLGSGMNGLRYVYTLLKTVDLVQV